MKKRDLHILMLEDNQFDAELNEEHLHQLEEYNCICNIMDNKHRYLEALENTTPDIILCDYNLPQYNGLEALSDLKRINPLIPFIFVTGTMKEEVAADAIKAGAWDYVVKDRLFRLPLAVRSVLKLKEEKEIAAKAEEKINRLLMAIEQTSTQIILFNKNNIIEYVNKKFTEVTGFKLKDVIGKPAQILNSGNPESYVTKDIVKKLNKGEVYRGEVLSHKKDGSNYWELISITPIRNSQNEITNYVLVKEDLTQQKLMEQQLLKALEKAESSDKLKDAFLQNLSHEIRTPLNAIVGFSELLSNRLAQFDNNIQNYASIISKNSEQLLSILTDIITMSHIHMKNVTLTNSQVNINKMFDNLNKIYRPIAQSKGLELIFHIESIQKRDLNLITDETKLTQIITNLIDNAIKFTQRGYVDVDCKIVQDQVLFSVKDTGLGIAEEALEYIFDRFRQADSSIHVHYGGTGLGLSISKSYAEMLGGTINVESEPGKGSVFDLSLPLVKSKTEHIQDIRMKSLKIETPATILIVEDEMNNYELLKIVLDNENVTLLHAENGLEAIEFVKKNQKIDLVLMDIKMPVMDGHESFKEIKKIRKNLPVIAQTAYALEADRQNFLESGFYDYISKPIKIDELYNKINKVFVSKE